MAVGVQPLADKMDEAMAAESQLYGSAITITQVDAEQQEPLYIMLNKVATDR